MLLIAVSYQIISAKPISFPESRQANSDRYESRQSEQRLNENGRSISQDIHQRYSIQNYNRYQQQQLHQQQNNYGHRRPNAFYNRLPDRNDEPINTVDDYDDILDETSEPQQESQTEGMFNLFYLLVLMHFLTLFLTL